MTIEEIVASLDKPARGKVAPAVERHLGALEGIGAVVSMKRGDVEAWSLAEI